MKQNMAFISIGVLIIVAIAGFFFFKQSISPSLQPTACTMEAMQCPDGSYVGRTGPSCAFAPCPASTSTPTTVNWISTTDTSQGISFKYPPTLGTAYINTTDWPPQVATTEGVFTCTQAGTTNAPAGKTVQRIIGGRTFCITEEGEGAAGSTYLNYAYATTISGKTRTFTFGLREVQCANYPEPQMTACATERQTFNPDTLMKKIVDTVTIN